MHQTIYGETLKKTKVLNRKSVDLFLESKENLYNQLNEEDCLYKNNLLIDSPTVNYLNVISDLSEKRQLNNLLRHEYESLEKIYQKLGSIFIEKFFNDKSLEVIKKYRLNKDNFAQFLETIENGLYP